MHRPGENFRTCPDSTWVAESGQNDAKFTPELNPTSPEVPNDCDHDLPPTGDQIGSARPGALESRDDIFLRPEPAILALPERANDTQRCGILLRIQPSMPT